jgi:elongation factor Ts
MYHNNKISTVSGGFIVRISAEDVKQLHLETGAGYMDAKRALEQAGGDAEQAKLLLRGKGEAIVRKKTARIAREGRIEIYHHTGDRIGVMLELNCETDFAAATAAFKALAHNLAMHVAAASPRYLSAADVPVEIIARESAVYEARARLEQAPEARIPAIVEDGLQKFYQTECLLEQPYIRDSARSVRDEVTACVAALKENVRVKRFVRYELGE